MLTGESRPVSKGVGEPAIGGAINGANAVTIEVTATGGKTYLAQVIELVKKAQATRSRTQDLANRAAAWLTYIALVVGFGTLIVRSEEHTSELQSLMRISYAVFCLKKKQTHKRIDNT